LSGAQHENAVRVFLTAFWCRAGKFTNLESDESASVNRWWIAALSGGILPKAPFLCNFGIIQPDTLGQKAFHFIPVF
jgi:hypothetical protein